MGSPTKSERDRAIDELVSLIRELNCKYTREYLINGGINLPRDTAETETDALYYFHRAATNGDINIRFTLGLMYVAGDGGVRQDFSCAYKWLTLAVDQGDEDAPKALRNLKILMSSEERDEGKRRVKEWRKQNNKGTRA